MLQDGQVSGAIDGVGAVDLGCDKNRWVSIYFPVYTLGSADLTQIFYPNPIEDITLVCFSILFDMYNFGAV